MKENLNNAIQEFYTLLKEQQERQKKMAFTPKKDLRGQDRITIGLIDGDGIGPRIMQSAKKALDHLLRRESEQGRIAFRTIPCMTIEERLALGLTVPSEALAAIRSCDVLLKGPTETPHGGNFESANVLLRRSLDLYANIRPIRCADKGIDWTFFRENSEGEYALGNRGIELESGMAVDFKITTPEGTRRIAREAFSFARRNGKKKLAIVTKANILKKTDGLFSQVARETAQEFPEIEVGEWYVDIMSANLVNDALQRSFEVFLLPNLYGDILTDEAAQICGGVGTAGSANVGAEHAMFEAIHGTAKRMIEEGRGSFANPESILRASAMMLRHIGYTEKGNCLDRALDRAAVLWPVTGREDGASCESFTDHLLSLFPRE